MALKKKIKDDLNSSIKSGDNVTRGVLRLLNSDIKNAEIEKHRELSDEEVVEIVKRSIKKHKDSIEQYREGNRKDLADQEEEELKILEKYMPEQMNRKEIEDLVKRVVVDIKASGTSDFGRVMGMVMKEIGNKADGNVVGDVVKDELDKIGN
jgi:hypothetical protein